MALRVGLTAHGGGEIGASELSLLRSIAATESARGLVQTVGPDQGEAFGGTTA
jgi:hypothetical protein